MALSLRLDLRQTQGLVMTPQLQQAIKLLQLSNLELTGYIAQELEQNPFLEPADTAEERGPEVEPEPAPERADEPAALTGQPDGVEADVAGDGWSGAPEDGWPDPDTDRLPSGLGMDSLGQLGRGGSLDFGDASDDLGERLSRPRTLREYLLEQLQLDLRDELDRLIGMHLIDLVDDDGYLRADLAEVAERLGAPLERVSAVLVCLQRCDPPGVCARSLPECLALQLREVGRLDPAMQRLLDHLDLLAQADFPALIKLCGVLPDDLPEMIAELKALDPKPGRAFGADSVQAVIPDVFVYRTPGGGFRVELNNATLPRVLVSTAYHADVASSTTDRRAREYLSERLQSANWLIKALDQRARTLLRVAEAVVERQLPFLNRGVQHLRPLVLRDIADVIGMHESTVSRATSDKYLGTPRGNFPFRYFFSNALPAAGGDSHAAEAIRQQIKTLIEREDPANVLSDDQIVESLQANGVMIARRTVAKYRESLAIPSSVQRRRAKALRLA